MSNLVDLSGYEFDNRGSYTVLKSEKEIEVRNYKEGEIPLDVVNRTAFAKWKEFVTPESSCYYDKILVRGTSEIIDMKTNKPTFYRKINSLIDATPSDKEEAKKFWHEFVSARMQKAKLEKKAFEEKSFVPQKRKSIEHSFNEFRREQAIIIELFSKMFTAKEIREIMLEKGINISVKKLQDFYKFHEDTITKAISSYKESFDDIRLAYKRSRLEEFAWIYHELKKDFRNPKTPLHKKTAFSKEMQAALKAIRDEVDSNQESNQNLTINQQINVHLTQEVLDRKTVSIVAIAKAAQSLGIEAQSLIYEMERSYYKQYNSFIGGNPLDENLSLPDQNYKPSDYDMDRIEKQVQTQHNTLKAKEDLIIQKRMEMRDKIKKQGVRERLRETLDISRKALSDSEPEQ